MISITNYQLRITENTIKWKCRGWACPCPMCVSNNTKKMSKQTIFSYFFAFICFFLINTTVLAQKDSILDTKHYQPKGVFLKKQAKIGENITYILTFRYPKDLQVLFPDTNYNFSPFELKQKRIFPTKTDKKTNLSLDSVIYELNTFDLQEKQILDLPIFYYFEGDSIKVNAENDTITLLKVAPTLENSKNSVGENPANSLEKQLKSNLQHLPLRQQVNYPYFVGGFLAILLFLWIVWRFSGKWFKMQFKLFQQRRRYDNFKDSFNKDMARIRVNKRVKDIENALSIWKKYLDDMENKPFTSYTSKEITQIINEPNLLESLSSIDKAIYGQIIDENLDKNLVYLKDLAKVRYIIKQKQIRGINEVIVDF